MTLSINWIPLTLTLLAAIHDLRTREVPDWISAALLAAALIATTLGYATGSWLSLAGGLALALAVGMVLFSLGGWGGADVKLLASLGAWLGPAGTLAMLFWMAIAGAGLSVVYWARGEKSLPYVPAIAVGWLIHIVWPEALTQLIHSRL